MQLLHTLHDEPHFLLRLGAGYAAVRATGGAPPFATAAGTALEHRRLGVRDAPRRRRVLCLDGAAQLGPGLDRQPDSRWRLRTGGRTRLAPPHAAQRAPVAAVVGPVVGRRLLRPALRPRRAGAAGADRHAAAVAAVRMAAARLVTRTRSGAGASDKRTCRRCCAACSAGTMPAPAASRPTTSPATSSAASTGAWRSGRNGSGPGMARSSAKTRTAICRAR